MVLVGGEVMVSCVTHIQRYREHAFLCTDESKRTVSVPSVDADC